MPASAIPPTPIARRSTVITTRFCCVRVPKRRAANENYVTNGKMTGGFAILAFPAQYRSSGVMAFIVGQDGAIYQKDLGPMTDKLAQQIDQYDPDSTWKRSP